jgi:hypothetical protein
VNRDRRLRTFQGWRASGEDMRASVFGVAHMLTAAVSINLMSSFSQVEISEMPGGFGAALGKRDGGCVAGRPPRWRTSSIANLSNVE